MITTAAEDEKAKSELRDLAGLREKGRGTGAYFLAATDSQWRLRHAVVASVADDQSSDSRRSAAVDDSAGDALERCATKASVPILHVGNHNESARFGRAPTLFRSYWRQ